MEQEDKPEISIVAPAYNEEANIGKFIDDCLETIKKINKKGEVVIVEDGSQDNTKKVIKQKIKENKKIRLIEHEKNKGYKQSFIDCIKNASGDIIVTIDSDLQYDIKELPFLLNSFGKNVDAVVGTRIRKQDSLSRRISSKMFTLATNMLFLSNFKDTNCIFRVFRKGVMDGIKFEAPTFQLPTELLIKWRLKKIRMNFVGIEQRARKKGESTFKLMELFFPTVSFLLRLRIKTIFS